jgi:hypothetical protein
MVRESLAGEWKLRPEFIDVGAERFAEVLSRPEGTFEILGPRHEGAYLKPFPKREGFLYSVNGGHNQRTAMRKPAYTLSVLPAPTR